MSRPPITPEMKVGQLLEHYPELEPTLIQLAPAFQKLKNPVLRRTVARVATLAHAARVGGVELRQLVAELRRAAGQQDLGAGEIAGAAGSMTDEPEPPWVARCETVARVDADALLSAGQHPIAALGPRIAALGPGQKLELRASFDPVPLTEALSSRGLRVFTRRNADHSTLTWIGVGEGSADDRP